MLAPGARGPRPRRDLRARLALQPRRATLPAEPVPSTSSTPPSAARAPTSRSSRTAAGCRKALAAADLLAARASRPRSIDLRVLRPLDDATIIGVGRADPPGRRRRRGAGARGASPPRSSARIVGAGFYELDAPVERVCSAEVPMPYPHAPGGGGAAAGRAHRRRRATGGGRPWVSSGCRRSAPTWSAGMLVEWLVKPGDPVRRGDIVAVVETPKSTVEVEVLRGRDGRASCSSRRVRRCRSGAVLARSRRRRGACRSAPAAAPAAPRGSSSLAAPPTPAAPEPVAARPRRWRRSPLLRRLPAAAPSHRDPPPGPGVAAGARRIAEERASTSRRSPARRAGERSARTTCRAPRTAYEPWRRLGHVGPRRHERHHVAGHPRRSPRPATCGGASPRS